MGSLSNDQVLYYTYLYAPYYYKLLTTIKKKNILYALMILHEQGSI